MLCEVCRRWLDRSDPRCRGCGTVRDGAGQLDLVFADGRRVALDRALSLGRGPANDVRFEDPSISREHARIELAAGRPVLIDSGSRFGTLLDGRAVQSPATLRAGSRVTLGDVDLTVQAAASAPMTMTVPAGMTLVIDRNEAQRVATAPATGRPRLRSGWSLKPLDSEQYVLKDHRSGAYMGVRAADAELVRRLDGEHELGELVALSARADPDGPARLARLLAELADRGMLAGVAGAPAASAPGLLRRLTRPRELTFPGAGGAVARLYRRGGFVLFTRPALAATAIVALMGLGAFVALIAAGSDTPLVVDRRLGLGALAFLGARLAVALCHELAHGLAAESSGRGVVRAGLKWVLVFPYAFVDVSDAWFDTAGRRMAITLAGPASDLALGGAFALACGLTPAGSAREILFQVSLAGYIGALFNLNPLLERDGYHVLADALGQPGLRRRAALRMREILAGRASRSETAPLLWRYGVASLCWSAVTVAFAIAMSLRYYHRLAAVAPRALVWTLLGAFYLFVAAPLALQLLIPLRHRASLPAVRDA